MRNWKIFCLVGLLIGLVFLSLIPTPPSKGQTGTLADIITAGVIQVGSDVAYPPFEDIDLDTGDVVGFDVDIMEELAAYISAEYDTTITVEFVASDWDPIIPNLQAEQFDVIMSAMTITSERELEVDFTRWYYQSAMGILVTTNNPKDIDHTDD
ncbi:MAG: transporter substrate-binding domain-containing protein, partial [Promethearchaeota archaeon]